MLWRVLSRRRWDCVARVGSDGDWCCNRAASGMPPGGLALAGPPLGALERLRLNIALKDSASALSALPPFALMDCQMPALWQAEASAADVYYAPWSV